MVSLLEGTLTGYLGMLMFSFEHDLRVPNHPEHNLRLEIRILSIQKPPVENWPVSGALTLSGGHVLVKPMHIKLVGHLTRTFNIKNRKEFEPQLLHRITGSASVHHSQYGNVQRAGRRDDGTRQTIVATDVEPLLWNCGSWYRPIDLQAQNMERK